MHGYLSLILTAHVPYVRAAGRDPDGEDVLHETIAHALVPLLNTLHDLREQGLRPPLAVAFSPLLLEQLADRVIQKHFVVWMDAWLARMADALAGYQHRGEDHLAYLAHFYLEWGQHIQRSFGERYHRNLVAGLRDLCDAGMIEPLVTPATYAPLPLLGRAESLQAQIDIGKLIVAQRLGLGPRGLWLPGCAYHPALDQTIRASEARYLIVDPSSMVAEPPLSHLRPRWVAPRQLAALLIDRLAAQQVWSFDLGYPGDPLYRAPRTDPSAGLAFWRNGIDPARGGELYDPYHAFRRAREHAAHFHGVVAAELRPAGRPGESPGVVVLPLDVGLLGRAWFEGQAWLRALLELCAADRSVVLSTPSAYLRAWHPRRSTGLRAGAWLHPAGGALADGQLWGGVHAAEERLARLARHFPHAGPLRERLINQALRELLLAQAGDSPLAGALDTAQDRHSRVQTHLQRFALLCDHAERAEPAEEDCAFLDAFEEWDNPFPNLNYRVFAGEE